MGATWKWRKIVNYKLRIMAVTEHLPVVAVVATHGEDWLGLLTDRALASIAKQTKQADRVVVVSDNDPLADFLNEEDIKSCFPASYRNNVRLIPNNRTRGNSGTGAWNTGILAALALGKDCWVAILGKFTLTQSS